jgi:hypothetical protein
MFNQSQLRWLAVWLLRVALAFAFLSAVADRFGLWGRFGVAGVAWGDFERFTAYTSQLLWFLPSHLVSPAAMLATAAELIVAGGLLAGWRLHSWAFAAAALLLSFALAMTCALGVKAPIDYSVWTAAAAAFLLGVVALREHGTDGTRTFDAEAPQTEAVSPGSRDPEGGQFMVNHRDLDPAAGPSHSPSRTHARQVTIPQPNKQ